MFKVLPLLAYKVKMFFGPSYRGRFGPFPIIGFSILFIPTGLGIGYAMGEYLSTTDTTQFVVTLGALFSAILAFGFVFSLGVGITAHPSELDFLMTAPVRPREYLISDLLFQFTTMTVLGGLAIISAVIGFIGGLGESFLLAIPLLITGGVFGLFVFMIVQIVTILRIRYPRARVRTIALILLFLSLLPAVMAVSPSSADEGAVALPMPQFAFAEIVSDILFGDSLDLYSFAVAFAYFVLIFSLWLSLSRAYFFHGVTPTLSGGFGQVDMGTKMAQQRKMIGFFGRTTSAIGLKTDVGSDLSLMTRLGLIRVWRDGSFFFIALLIGLFTFTGAMGSEGEDTSGRSISMLQAAGWPIAIIAINWCYYERENLWIPVVGGRSLLTYFRGLMLSFVVIGLFISGVMLCLSIALGIPTDGSQVAYSVIAPIADSAVAAVLLTMIKVKPGAFSFGLLGIMFLTFVGGAMIAYPVSYLVGFVEDYGGFAVQMAVMAAAAVAVVFVGLIAVEWFARNFRF